jgi:hypothetical protein
MEETFKVSVDHPLCNLMLKVPTRVSIVHVRDQVLEDGVISYGSLVQKSEQLFKRNFHQASAPHISALFSSKSAILLAVTGKGDKSDCPFLLLSALLFHPLEGGGFISYAATHAGKFGKQAFIAKEMVTVIRVGVFLKHCFC